MTGEKRDLREAKDIIIQKLESAISNKYVLALVAIIGFSAAIRFRYAFFEGMWVDESIHGRLAKELPKHLLEYSLPQKGGPMVKRPPVYNYLVAFSNMLFGGVIGTDTAVRIVSPVMGTLGVVSTYFLGREVKNRKVGLAAASILSVTGIYWFLSERILMGATLTALFTTTVLAFYYGLEDKKYSKYAVWSWGPLIALTALTKQPGYVLGPVILIYFLYRKRNEISDYLMTDKDFRSSKMYDLVKDRNYYIAIGLFMAVMIPWMIRNMSVCQFPLCSFKQALSIATSTGNIDVQGPLYFITSLPGLLSLPVFGLLAFNLVENIFGSFTENQDIMVKKTFAAVVLTGGAYVLSIELLPLALVSSAALFARSDGEKLLWLTAGLGIGLMSVNATKVARYIIFVVPSLIVLASISLWNISEKLEKVLPDKKPLNLVNISLIMLLFLAPILALNFTAGLNQVTGQSFQSLEPAGEWMNQNTPEDARIYATSPQVRYWAYPRMPVASAGRIPDDETGFRQFLKDENISYVMIGVYERTQPDWLSTEIPPYRLYPDLVNQIRSGSLSAQEATQMYGSMPEYLQAVESFGEGNIPLTRQSQPNVIIYRVNQTAL